MVDFISLLYKLYMWHLLSRHKAGILQYSKFLLFHHTVFTYPSLAP